MKIRQTTTLHQKALLKSKRSLLSTIRIMETDVDLNFEQYIILNKCHGSHVNGCDCDMLENKMI